MYVSAARHTERYAKLTGHATVYHYTFRICKIVFCLNYITIISNFFLLAANAFVHCNPFLSPKLCISTVSSDHVIMTFQFENAGRGECGGGESVGEGRVRGGGGGRV